MRRWKGGCIAGPSWLRIVGVGDRPVPVFLLFESRTKSPTVKGCNVLPGRNLVLPGLDYGQDEKATSDCHNVSEVDAQLWQV